jgi:hypothetical protein
MSQNTSRSYENCRDWRISGLRVKIRKLANGFRFLN